MANELQVTKEQTAQFVNNTMEMEKAIFTLDRAIEDCESKKKVILDEARAKENESKSKKDNLENELEKVNEKINSCSSFSPGYSWGGLFATIWFGTIPIVIITFVVCLLIIMPIFEVSFGTVCGISAYGGFVIAIFVGIWYGKHEMNEKIDKNQQQIKEYEQEQIKISEDLRIAQNAYNNALRAQKRAIESAGLLDAQKEQLKENRDSIYQSLTTCYENNIIKPKYRNIECVVIMNELYQNDRVDTMREAMDKCEERLFQNEIVRGVHNINTMLGKMVISLAEISSTLESINFNLGMMSQDLFDISDRIAQGQREQQKSNEELIKETKLSRYAAERTAAAATYMEWYGPDRR